MKIELSPATRERLLGLADELVTKLRNARVYLVSAPQQGEADSLGIPASCVGHATSYLYQHRDLETFKSFVDHLNRLDTLTGQNLENPRAHHAALQRVLWGWLERYSDLSAEECLYVLAWARRLSPKKSKKNPNSARRPAVVEPPPQPAVEPFRGNQLGMELLAFLGKEKPDSTD